MGQIEATDYLADEMITGGRGDVVFMDPWVFHSANPCLEGFRLNLVLSFIANSSLDGAFLHFSGSTAYDAGRGRRRQAPESSQRFSIT